MLRIGLGTDLVHADRITSRQDRIGRMTGP